jgi:hypothetical protein
MNWTQKVFDNTPIRNFTTGNPDLYFPDLDLDLSPDLGFSGRRRIIRVFLAAAWAATSRLVFFEAFT